MHTGRDHCMEASLSAKPPLYTDGAGLSCSARAGEEEETAAICDTHALLKGMHSAAHVEGFDQLQQASAGVCALTTMCNPRSCETLALRTRPRWGMLGYVTVAAIGKLHRVHGCPDTVLRPPEWQLYPWPGSATDQDRGAKVGS